METEESLKIHETLDLLIREVDSAWWSEGCLFNLTSEENDRLVTFIKEYNSDGHLDLICGT